LLVTPLADRFLNGITRQTVIEMAKSMGVKVREERLTLDDIELYDECFVTGTSAEIKKVSSIDFNNQKVEFTAYSMTENLQQEYEKIVGK
jgi:branched-chain amino acid aminotransferase